MAGLRTKVRALNQIVYELAGMMEDDCDERRYARLERIRELRTFLESLDEDLSEKTPTAPART